MSDPVQDLINSLGFHNARNDQYAYMQGAQAGRRLMNQSPTAYAAQSARDLAENVANGLSSVNGGSSPNTASTAVIYNNIALKLGNREIAEVFQTAIDLTNENQMNVPGGSQTDQSVQRQRLNNLEVSTQRAMTTANQALIIAEQLRDDS